jgi:hypothetical protein
MAGWCFIETSRTEVQEMIRRRLSLRTIASLPIFHPFPSYACRTGNGTPLPFEREHKSLKKASSFSKGTDALVRTLHSEL